LMPWLTPVFSIIMLQYGSLDLVGLYVGYCTIESHTAQSSLNRWVCTI
jgi:hypothetical protein